MPHIEIKNKYDDSIIIAGEYENIKDCLEKNKCANLTRANLTRANLAGANLTGANLTGAYLADANLTDANLAGAYLAGAYLTRANLTRANLTRANLTRANLAGANLTGAYLADANLADANLTDANLAGAYLARAYLTGANLTRANLTRANLTRANLAGANLTDANLAGANLAGAINYNKYAVQPLLMLHDQPGNIRAYKVVNNKYEGIYNGGLVYKIGSIVKVPEANTDEFENCEAGINVATLDWCIKEYSPEYKILIVEFKAKDIACIPITSDGKFRLFKCKVIGEIDYAKYGLNTEEVS